MYFFEKIPILGSGWITPIPLPVQPSPSCCVCGKWWLVCHWVEVVVVGWLTSDVHQWHSWWWEQCQKFSKIRFKINKNYGIPLACLWDEKTSFVRSFNFQNFNRPLTGLWSLVLTSPCYFRSWLVHAISGLDQLWFSLVTVFFRFCNQTSKHYMYVVSSPSLGEGQELMTKHTRSGPNSQSHYKISVWKSGPVWFFDSKGHRPGLRPVLKNPDLQKTGLNWYKLVFCSLLQLQDWSKLV